MSTPQYAIITGAASGLGRALAVRLAREGCCVALCDVNVPGAEEALRIVREAGGVGRVERLDVTQPSEWASLIDRLSREWPTLDWLINNAGVAGAGEVGAFPLDDWRWLMEVNLWGVIHGCHAAVDWLKRNPRGARLVNVASVAGFVHPPAMGAYSVSKAGVIALSETLRCELAPHDVSVTVACPGFFPTGLLAAGRFVAETDRKTAQDYFDRAQITPDDVAQAIVASARRRKLHVVLPKRAWTVWFVKRLFPRAFVGGLARWHKQRVAEAQTERTR